MAVNTTEEGSTLRRFTTGPIDEDHRSGDIWDLHVEALNTTGAPIRVTARFYALLDGERRLLDEQVEMVDVHAFFSQRTFGREHLEVEVEHAGDGEADVLFTVQGRNKLRQGLAEATYRHSELVELTPVMFVFGGFNQLTADTPGLVFVRVRVGENVVSPTTPLRYRVTLTECDGDPVAGQSFTYPGPGADPTDPTTWSTITTDANGQAFFGPPAGFTLNDLPELLEPLGATTPFIGALPAGCYFLRVELINVSDMTVVGQGAVRFVVPMAVGP